VLLRRASLRVKTQMKKFTTDHVMEPARKLLTPDKTSWSKKSSGKWTPKQ
jgi:hypothetical protein